MDKRVNVSLEDAAKALLWKLSHNHCLPDYSGPARITRDDATVRELEMALADLKATPGLIDATLAAHDVQVVNAANRGLAAACLMVADARGGK